MLEIIPILNGLILSGFKLTSGYKVVFCLLTNKIKNIIPITIAKIAINKFPENKVDIP